MTRRGMILRAKVCAVVGIVALLAAACHGYTLSSNAVYWYDSAECLDRTSQIQLDTSPRQGRMHAYTGYFHADANGCHAAAQTGGWLEATAELHRVDTGLCGYIYSWVVNPGGYPYAHFETYLPVFCGEANYAVITHHHGLVNVTGTCCDWVNSSGLSPADHWA